jgi:hypothetical protein
MGTGTFSLLSYRKTPKYRTLLWQFNFDFDNFYRKYRIIVECQFNLILLLCIINYYTIIVYLICPLIIASMKHFSRLCSGKLYVWLYKLPLLYLLLFSRKIFQVTFPILYFSFFIQYIILIK